MGVKFTTSSFIITGSSFTQSKKGRRNYRYLLPVAPTVHNQNLNRNPVITLSIGRNGYLRIFITVYNAAADWIHHFRRS
jgi:hypothetical protein